MAIALDANLGKNTTNVSGNTITLTTANAAAAGSKLITGWFLFNATTNFNTPTATGLTFNLDKTFRSGSLNLSIYSADAASIVSAGTVITSTLTGTFTGSKGVCGLSFTGLNTGTTLDGTPGSASGTTTAYTCGAITTTNANDLIVGINIGDATADTTSTPSGAWVEAPNMDFNSAGNGDTYELLYQIVSATGTYNPAGTYAALASGSWAGASAAYIGSGGGGGGTTTPAFQPRRMPLGA